MHIEQGVRDPLPRGVVVLLGAASAVVVLAGMRGAADIVGPGLLALVIVITVSPMQQWLRRHRVPAWLASTLTMVVVYGVLLALAAALAWSVARLATLLPRYSSEFSSVIDTLGAWVNGVGITDDQITTALSSLDPNRVVSVLQGVLSGTAGVLTDLLFLVTLLFFLIIEALNFPRRFAMAEATRPDVTSALLGFTHGVRRYVWVSTVFGLIVAVFDIALLYWLSVPLPLLWGLLSFITNYIPNIGFVIGLVPPALLALLDGGPKQMLWVVLGYSVINVVIQSLIQPKFVGDAVGLSMSLTFLSLVFWAFVLGPLGALLAVPLSLLAKALLVDADPTTRWLNPLLSADAAADAQASGTVDRRE